VIPKRHTHASHRKQLDLSHSNLQSSFPQFHLQYDYSTSTHTSPRYLHYAVRARNTWKFEYTGDPEPQMESAWGEHPNEMGSEGYKKMMTHDVLSGDSFASDILQGRPPNFATERKIPANYTVDEVIAIIKGAMFEISDWLLEVEAAERQRNCIMDGDLCDDYSYGDRDGNGGQGDAGQEDEGQGDYRTEYTGSRDGVRSRGGRERSSYPPYSSSSRPIRSDSRFNRIPEEDEEEGDEMADEGDHEDEDEDDDDETAPPPQYEEGYNTPPYSSRPVSGLSTGGLSHSRQTRPLQPQKQPTEAQVRVNVIFRAFVDAQNNKAKWLGKNEKLTRLKFQGGIERVLRLKMTWQQFDTLWCKLDNTRSGDLDMKEFKEFFGDIGDFNSAEGKYCVW
jgi:hypothetical protein